MRDMVRGTALAGMATIGAGLWVGPAEAQPRYREAPALAEQMRRPPAGDGAAPAGSAAGGAGGSARGRIRRHLAPRLPGPGRCQTTICAWYTTRCSASPPTGDFLTHYVATLAASGSSVSMEQMQALRASYGLDQPFLVQHWLCLKHLVVATSACRWNTGARMPS